MYMNNSLRRYVYTASLDLDSKEWSCRNISIYFTMHSVTETTIQDTMIGWLANN